MRTRARLFASLALAWQVLVMIAVPSAFSCGSGLTVEHSGMADCPTHASQPACPLHAEQHGGHACDCPTLGCSQADSGFMALFGPAGVLPASTSAAVPVQIEDVPPVMSPSANSLAPVPLAPPPRA